MLNKIKSQWRKLKTEYENRYNKTFLIDFESSKEYLEKIKSYLLGKQSECPSNVDVICTLASVCVELRYENFDYVEFLKKFLNEFENSLSDNDKARIYTNLAFASAMASAIRNGDTPPLAARLSKQDCKERMSYTSSDTFSQN